MNKHSKIYVAGHSGLVGSAIVRVLSNNGYSNLILRKRSELDLTNQKEVNKFFSNEGPNYVFLAAAKVGGILANSKYPADFIFENLTIQTNIIHAAYSSNVDKLLFLGSTCIYPKMAEQPIKEESLLTGSLEETNEWYAIAKIAGIKLCQAYQKQYGCNFISAMPTNLYGPGDNFDINNSHVLAALIRKFHDAKLGDKPFVEVWGTGRPRREFMHVDDCADACLYLMLEKNNESITNVGVGKDISILELANLVKKIVGYNGGIVFDIFKPDGTPQKSIDVSKLITIGWQPKISLAQGIENTYQWYKQTQLQ